MGSGRSPELDIWADRLTVGSLWLRKRKNPELISGPHYLRESASTHDLGAV